MAQTGILFGFHAVQGRLRADPGSIEEILVDTGRADPRMKELERQAAERGVRVLRVDAARLAGFAGDGRHQGVVARVLASRQRWTSFEDCLDAVTAEPPLVLVLDGVTDPHNLGAILRAADGAGVHAVIAPKDRAAGISATVSKVASGAAESVPYFMVPNLARALGDLKERGLWVVGLADDAPDDLYAADLPAPLALVLGAEGAGMRRLTRERCDALVRLPMRGAVESLNVSVAAGICLYEARRRRLAAPGGGGAGRG
jgi:23S rRNA (guanosine2251-2'-O)-methyltransferase